MKKIYLGLVIVGLIVLAGCANTAKTTEPQAAAGGQDAEVKDAKDTAEASSSKVGLNTMYKYGQLKSYEYKLVSEASTVNMKYTISSDSVDGVAAWLQKSEITAQGAVVISNMWVDKATQKCLKVNSVMNVNGQEITQAGQCPIEGAASGTGAELESVGKESVTVPAGAFNCDKYAYQGSSFYWVSSDVPLPVKISTNNGKAVMELVSYS